MEVVLYLGEVPGIKDLVHDHQAHAVGKIQVSWCGWVVGSSESVVAHLHQDLNLAFGVREAQDLGVLDGGALGAVGGGVRHDGDSESGQHGKSGGDKYSGLNTRAPNAFAAALPNIPNWCCWLSMICIKTFASTY